MKYQAVRGTRDILPDEIRKRQEIEAKARQIFSFYGYAEIQTPIFEMSELFVRSIGTATDIVEKEMYTFQDKKGRNLTLRPEGTAPVVRAYLENNLGNGLTKLFYIGQMFRYERPQTGRTRQHTQIGAEAIGSGHPALDAEIISMAVHFFNSLGLAGLTVKLNSIGCRKCRPEFQKVLLAYLSDKVNMLCADCRDRMQRNPMRILDCKDASCQEVIEKAPETTAYLCGECKEHFKTVMKLVDALNLKYQLNKRLVRGFDYYTRTVFEIDSNELGAQSAVAGGGRYDGLIEELGGKPTPAVGFSCGIERIIISSKEKAPVSRPDLFFACLGETAVEKAFVLADELRKAGRTALLNYEEKSLKSQLRSANQAGAAFVIIIGEDEIKKQAVQIKDMSANTQAEVAFNRINDYLTEHERKKK